jgi:hypothetical protein
MDFRHTRGGVDLIRATALKPIPHVVPFSRYRRATPNVQENLEKIMNFGKCRSFRLYLPGYLFLYAV